MDDLSREYISDFYTRRLRMFGDSPDALSWTTRGQIERYEALQSLTAAADGESILDYGCGKADLYGFLRDRGVRVKYTGMDITPALLDFAAVKYPECSFVLHDIERAPLERDFDVIFICGVFNLAVEGASDGLRNSMRLLFRHARRCMAVSALSSRAAERSFMLNYMDPSELEGFARDSISRWVETRLDMVKGDIIMLLRH